MGVQQGKTICAKRKRTTVAVSLSPYSSGDDLLRTAIRRERCSVEKKDGIAPRRTMSANTDKRAIGCAVYDVVPVTICSARLSVESVARRRKRTV